MKSVATTSGDWSNLIGDWFIVISLPKLLITQLNIHRENRFQIRVMFNQ